MNTVNNRFASILSMTWWVLMLRGVLAIIFGVLTWREPELSVALHCYLGHCDRCSADSGWHSFA